jgi:hypothetical protein
MASEGVTATGRSKQCTEWGWEMRAVVAERIFGCRWWISRVLTEDVSSKTHVAKERQLFSLHAVDAKMHNGQTQDEAGLGAGRGILGKGSDILI